MAPGSWEVISRLLSLWVKGGEAKHEARQHRPTTAKMREDKATERDHLDKGPATMGNNGQYWILGLFDLGNQVPWSGRLRVVRITLFASSTLWNEVWVDVRSERSGDAGRESSLDCFRVRVDLYE